MEYITLGLLSLVVLLLFVILIKVSEPADAGHFGIELQGLHREEYVVFRRCEIGGAEPVGEQQGLALGDCDVEYAVLETAEYLVVLRT